jgi:phage terminase large subunit
MVQQLLNEARLFVFRHCSSSIAEFETYHYPEKVEGNTKENPVEKDNHIMDAIRYAIHGYTPAKRYPRPPSKVTKISRLLSKKPDELQRSPSFTSQFE